MNTGQTNVEHTLRILDTVINELATRFHIYKKNKDEEDSTKHDEHISLLSTKIAYVANITIGATKTWNYEERIMKLEEEKDNPIPTSVRKEYMFNPDIMLTVVRDNNGKLMN